MTALQQLDQAASAKKLEFLLIGGFAVNAHGYSRMTGDIDLAVRKKDRGKWTNLAQTLGYRVKSEEEAFLQFDGAGSGQWPLDLMLLNDPTFDGLWAASIETPQDDRMFHVVSLDHLLALKLHVLKQAKLHRFMKDFQDVVTLVLINKVNLRSEKYRQLFEKYGTLDLYEKVIDSCRE